MHFVLRANIFILFRRQNPSTCKGNDFSSGRHIYREVSLFSGENVCDANLQASCLVGELGVCVIMLHHEEPLMTS